MTNLNETIRTTADRIFCGLEETLTEGATAEEKARINDLLHEGFDPADSYASVYIVPFLQDIAKDCGMTAETFEVDEEAVIDHFADDIRDLRTEGKTMAKKTIMDGWHTICGCEVYVEDGKIIRGMKEDRNHSKVPAWVYRYNSRERVWVREYGGITVAAFRAGYARETIDLK